MKSLILAIIFSLQTLLSSAALAWSPLESIERAVGQVHSCYLVTASDDNDDGADDEEEEEPDCD